MIDNPRNRPLLYMMTWRCTRACNYNCLYCSFASNPYPVNEIDTKGGKKIVDELHEMGAKWFGLSGGEPLVRKDIFEVIAHAKNLGMNVSLITNGYYVKGDLLDNLAKHEVMTTIVIMRVRLLVCPVSLRVPANPYPIKAPKPNPARRYPYQSGVTPRKSST